MRKQIIKFLFLLLVFGYAMEAKSDEFTVDGIRYYYDYSTKEGEVSVTRSISGKYSADNIVIPSTVTYNGKQYTVTSIGDNAFSSCYNLTKVTIPNSVKTIENSAFKGCTGLKTVTIGNSVTTIGISAFAGCTGLTEVTIPNSVTTIWSGAFAGCTGLTEVTIPNSVTTIWSGAFGHCDNLKKVIWNARNVENPPRSSPFSNCDQLTNFIFGENIQSIPSHLCYELKSLNTIIIPNSATSIGDFAFSSCTGLTEVTIPNSVTKIGYEAFAGCTGLTEVTIPNSVTEIGSGAFDSCTGLTTVTMGNSMKNIGSSAFAGCTGLTKVTIPNSVTFIGTWAFKDCSGLAAVTIGNSVNSMGDGVFAGCTGLTTVTMGNSVLSIEDKAFYNCKSLDHVTSKAMLPPRIWATTFDDYAMPLYVPNGCKSRYSGAEYWRNFTDIREATLYKVTANATDETMGYVTGAGEYPKGSTATLVAVPFGQNYFVRWNDGNTDNPRTITVTGDMTFTAEFAPAGSAVETLENGERGIYATGRTLHVENGGESYRVYTAAGRLVYTGNDSSVTLSAPGMYIVRTGDRSQKVAVK